MAAHQMDMDTWFALPREYYVAKMLMAALAQDDHNRELEKRRPPAAAGRRGKRGR
jgi:hypothetical protein